MDEGGSEEQKGAHIRQNGFLFHPQIIHTALLQPCKADFSPRQMLLQNVWGSKSLEYLSAGVCSENVLLL